MTTEVSAQSSTVVAVCGIAPDAPSLEIHIATSDRDRFCLGLILLSEDLTDELLVHFSDATMVTLGKSTPREKKLSELPHWRLMLDQDSIGHLAAFFLRFFRDGVAEVDHVDLDLQPPYDSVCFRVSDYKAPMTPADAKRWLDAL